MGSVASSVTSLEALVGTKDKSGRGNKKAAAKNLKEKRAEKKNKREAATTKSKIV